MRHRRPVFGRAVGVSGCMRSRNPLARFAVVREARRHANRLEASNFCVLRAQGARTAPVSGAAFLGDLGKRFTSSSAPMTETGSSGLRRTQNEKIAWNSSNRVFDASCRRRRFRARDRTGFPIPTAATGGGLIGISRGRCGVLLGKRRCRAVPSIETFNGRKTRGQNRRSCPCSRRCAAGRLQLMRSRMLRVTGTIRS